MKKTFINPEMNISLFNMENVVTDSTNVAVAAEELTTKHSVTAENITTIDWTF